MRESDGIHRAGDRLGTLVPVHRPQQPERRLQLAVLEKAIIDWNFYKDKSGYVAYQQCGDSRRWFAADDENRPHSFLSICSSFGLDADAVRERIFRGEPLEFGNLHGGGKLAQPSVKRLTRAGNEETIG